MFGTIIHAIFRVTLILLSVILCICPIFGAFTLFFHFLGNKDLGVVAFGATIQKTFSMMLGNIEIDNESNSMTYNILNVSFMIFVCIVVMNVLIGLTVSRIDVLLDRAHLTRLEKTASCYKVLTQMENDGKMPLIFFMPKWDML